MFNESVLCGENKSKTSGRVTPPTKPAWLLCLPSGDWQVNSLSLEHSSLPREPGRLSVPKTALFSPLHRAALTWSPQPWRQLREPSASPGQRQETPDCRDPWRHRPSLEAEDSRQVTATETRISVSQRQVGAESESLSQVISLSLGSQVQLLWGPTLCPDDFFEPLAPSSEADEASEVESHGGVRGRVPRKETDQRQVPGPWACNNLQPQSSAPWVSPFSVYCPHASFLSPPMARPRSCQASLRQPCALPADVWFYGLIFFWQEGCFLHQAHHQNHLGVFIKTRNALPKNRGASVSLGDSNLWPWGRAGDQKFLCIILIIKLGKRCHFPQSFRPTNTSCNV